MAISKTKKEEILKKLEDKISKAKSLVFIGYDKVKIADQDNLRKSLKKEKGELMFTKKTLLNLVLKNLKIKDLEKLNLEKEVAIAFGYEDEVVPARVVAEIAKKAENLKIKGGVLEKQLVDIEKIKFLSSLPSKQVLQAQLLSVLQGPLSGLVNVLQGNLKALVCLFKSIAEKNN